MTEQIIGAVAFSNAGHDKNKAYIIIKVDRDKGLVWLSDGRIRKLESPKKKNIKHVKVLESKDAEFVNKVLSQSITNEEIKHFLKCLEVIDV